jgi:hypothetical protein
MYSIEYNDIVMACIFCIVYVGSKLWMYHNHTKQSNTKKKGVIKRGWEWPE